MIHDKSTSADIALWVLVSEGLGHYADLRNGGLVEPPRRFTIGAKSVLWLMAGGAAFVAGVLAGLLAG